jgi:hypothetical protein
MQVSLEELKGHEKWVVEQRFVTQKRQALERGMERDVEQLRTWARQVRHTDNCDQRQNSCVILSRGGSRSLWLGRRGQVE